jgi:predicted Zn-dependent protease
VSRRLAATALAAALAVSSVAVAQDAAPPAASSSPPPAVTPRPTAPEEAGLWDLADESERDAQNSAELNPDPALNAYLQDLACRVAAGHCRDIRLYVMNRPFFNAMMAPNGYTEIWSGLLLRADNEAEAAFVIGHEIGHFTEQHSVAMQDVVRERMNAALVAGMVLGAAAAGAAANSPTSAGAISDAANAISNVMYLGAIASVFGFSREMEDEADRLGFERAMAAGYDPRAGAALWRSLVAETQASDNPRTRRSVTRGSIFSTHPVTTDRIAALEQLAVERGAAGELHRARYRAAIRPFLAQWLRDDLRRRDYGQTLHLVARLGQHGEDLGVLRYFEGEAHRLRRAEGDLARAQEAYAAAITYEDAPAEAFREHGTALLRSGDRLGAAAAYEAYLRRAPDALDRALIEQDIATLRAATP